MVPEGLCHSGTSCRTCVKSIFEVKTFAPHGRVAEHMDGRHWVICRKGKRVPFGEAAAKPNVSKSSCRQLGVFWESVGECFDDFPAISHAAHFSSACSRKRSDEPVGLCALGRIRRILVALRKSLVLPGIWVTSWRSLRGCWHVRAARIHRLQILLITIVLEIWGLWVFLQQYDASFRNVQSFGTPLRSLGLKQTGVIQMQKPNRTCDPVFNRCQQMQMQTNGCERNWNNF